MSSANSEVPTGDVADNSYVSRTGQNQIPVQSDNKPIEDPIDPDTADSDETLGMSMRLRNRKIASFSVDDAL